MADKTQFDSTPSQISKDGQGSDSVLPLSPQWLLPKPGESKAGIMTRENHSSQCPGHANRSDTMKSPGIGEEIRDSQKKKDVFRPSMLDMESGRRDRWREEERDTNSSIRRDRWREGDRELGDNRKVDRWIDSSSRHVGEARRVPSERWTDSTNRETNHDQHRESKWNTRWGPDDKETDSFREKWTDSNKDVDTLNDRGLSHPPNQGKDEREGDHYRPWRPNPSLSHGKTEPPHRQTPSKQSPAFVQGRGRPENATPTFSLGRGRISSSGVSTSIPAHSQLVVLSEKVESDHGEPSPLKYSRNKLLDVYRMTDMRSREKLLDGFGQVPSLTQEKPLEPLAFCAPSPEESAILKGIDKGEIVGSGAPQINKDGSLIRNSTEFMQSRRSKLGSREELSLAVDDGKDEFNSNSNETQVHAYGSSSATETVHDNRRFPEHNVNVEALGEDGSLYRRNDMPPSRGSSTDLPGSTWRSLSMGERTHAATPDLRDAPTDIRSRTSETGWSLSQKDLNEWASSLADSSSSKDGTRWRIDDDQVAKQEAQRLSQLPPEDLILYYKDPQGAIQGPFASIDIIGWFEAGYFGIDLQVRLASAPKDSPFSLLGDVMPHLRAKALPPPGFGGPKNEILDSSSRSNFSTLNKLDAGSGDIDMTKSEPRYTHTSTTEAENRFLESLMSSNISSGLRGVQGYLGNTPGALPTLGGESGDNLSLLAKRMTLERQISLPHPYSYWPGRDASIISNSDIIQDNSMLHSKVLPSIADNPHQQPHSKDMELMSILQGLPNRSNSDVNNAISGWSNFPVQGGLDPLLDKLDKHHSQNISPHTALGIQQQRLQPPNQPPLAHLLAQPVDSSSGMLTSEKLLSSGLSTDPQLLNLLQQQYLLQLHSLAPPPSQQLSLLDKLLLLQQQQQQEEQQQLLRQQQQLLSQVLSEHHSHQRFGELAHGQLQATSMPMGNASVNHPQLQQMNELFQVGSQMRASNLQDDRLTNFLHMASTASEDPSHTVGSDASSVTLPHQIFGDTIHQKRWGTILPDQGVDIQPKSALLESSLVDTVLKSAAVDKILEEKMLQNLRISEPVAVAASDSASAQHIEKSIAVPLPGNGENEVLMTQKVNELEVPLAAEIEEPKLEREECREVKNAEVCEVKKGSEKKSKKQKPSKSQLSELGKGLSKAQQSKQSKSKEKPESLFSGEMPVGTPLLQVRESKSETVEPQENINSLPAGVSGVSGETVEMRNKVGQTGSGSQSGQCAWKPAPGFKPKSLLEIQQEEQNRAQAEMAVSEISTSISSKSFSTPWSGVVTNLDHKSSRNIHQDAAHPELNLVKYENSVNHKSKKSQLHDLLGEVLGKSAEKEMEVLETMSSVPPLLTTSSQSEPVDDDNFIAAKDTKKSRKKSAKAKGAGAKVSVAVVDGSVGSSQVEKGKSSRQSQQEKDVLPAVPTGPSLGDFVVWKGGEAANSAPTPAWLTESGKLPKPTSLRDIQKEQERKVSSSQQTNAVPLQKSLPSQPSRGSGSSWPSASPAKSSPIQNNLQASQLKQKVDDDLFWGPVDQSKQEPRQQDFPHLSNQGSWGNKSTPAKGTPGGSLVRQKSISGRPDERSLSSSPASAQSSLKGKKNALTKHSEAMDFRNWCESECVRLIGTKDTSFLEFCLKQSRSEAEMLLIENLGLYDPDHEFIDKFLNYKDFLPADVLEFAFQSRNDRKVTGFGAGEVNSDSFGWGDSDVADGSAKGGKKKGKKGKKMSPDVLGFNVVSNRIMMGEIQSVED